MWWINKNGSIEGPLSTEQLEKRIKLNMLRSLDRISEDRNKWFFVKDTVLWNPTRTIKDPPPPPPPPAHLQRIQPTSSIKMTAVADGQGEERPIMARPAEPLNASPVPERLRTPNAADAKPSSTKKLWIAFIAVVVLALSGFAIMAFLMVKNSTSKIDRESVDDDIDSAEEGSKDDESQVGFSTVKDKLVIIECKEGSGSGFLLEMDGKTYLVTNEHVIRSVSSPRARLLDGTSLQLGDFSVAGDRRDLARFEVVGCSIVPFKASKALPNIGDFVALYGNTLGHGVATESKGYIQGVGPKRIEANVEIVHGNSGSPIVMQDGLVIGVASFVLPREQDDYQAQNTRYESSPRRFAIRLNDVEWTPVDRRQYEEQVAVLHEFETYWKYLLPYLLCDRVDVAGNKLVFRDIDRKRFTHRGLGFEEMLEVLSKTYKRRTKVLEQSKAHQIEGKRLRERLDDSGVGEEAADAAINEFNEKQTELFEKAKGALRDMILKRKEALSVADNVLSGEVWVAPQLSHGRGDDSWEKMSGAQFYRELISEYMEEANQDLKDLNKLIEKLEKGDDDEDDE